MALVGLPLRATDRQLLGLKNRHAGERAFVVGNGPSLRIEDLDRVTNEVTFGANKVFLAFEKTRWRPRYYCAVDALAPEFLAGFSQGGLGEVNFFPDYLKGIDVPSSVFFPLRHDPDATPWPAFSGNPIRGLMQGFTVTYICMQLACWMGIRDLYLIGVDCKYAPPASRPVDVRGSVEVFRKTSEDNYFIPDYHRKGETFSKPMVEEQILAYQAARKAYERKGWRILNASRGGALEVFDRVSFDSLF